MERHKSAARRRGLGGPRGTPRAGADSSSLCGTARGVPRWDWPYGSREFMATIDRIVVEIDARCMVGMERRRGLRDWLVRVVFGYFELRALIRSRLTDRQEGACRRRIGQLGADLRREIVRLYGFDDHTDISALEEIVKRAERGPRPLPDVWETAPLGFDTPPTRASNARKDGLHLLSEHICLFWLPVSWWRQADGDLPFDFSSGSPAFRFARYVFAVVGEATCTDRMIEKRLGAASTRRQWDASGKSATCAVTLTGQR